MLALSFIVPLTILSLIALIINATILFIVILCKQVSPSNILLFHLGIVESLLSVVFLIFSVPLLAHGDENTTVNAICNANAFFLTLLHPIALWTVCGLNFDRYYCISAPLHYNAIVSSNKVICGLVCGWFVALLGTIPPLFDVAPYRLYKDIGICLPHFTDANSLWYAITFTMCTFIIPGSLIIVCNVKVFMIARYHRHRIAAAIFEVTLSAQVTITHQRNPFPLPFEAIPPKLRARSPVNSVFQIVGSLLLLYCPYYITIIWQSSLGVVSNRNAIKNLEMPCSIILLAFVLMHLTVFVNIIIYGLKSKVMRKSVKNYWRKQKTKNEINNEIQARTPSTCGSRRPSLNALNLSRSVSHRRLSETFVNLNQMTNGNRPKMKRIASELSWQPISSTSPITLLPHASSDTLQIPHNEFNGNFGSCTNDDDGNGRLEDQIRMMRIGSLSTSSLQTTAAQCYTRLPAAYFQSTCKEVKKYIQIGTKKMFHIDLNDTIKRIEPLSPLRSPQILITSANSDDSDTKAHSSPVVKLKTDHLFSETVFDQKTICRIDFDEKSDDSSDDNLPIEMLFSSPQLKRCVSLDEPELSKCSSSNCGEIDEPLLLSWPITRKKYKHGVNASTPPNDRSDESRIVL